MKFESYLKDRIDSNRGWALWQWTLQRGPRHSSWDISAWIFTSY